MYSLVYGIIFIVCLVGGFKDMVIDYSNDSEGMGFVFDEFMLYVLLFCICWVLLVFYEDVGKFRVM